MSQPGAQPISVRATSTPSPDVPDMTPTTYAVPVAMWHVARVCSWGAGGRGRDAPRERGLGSSSARHHSNLRVHNKHSNVLCMCMLCVMRFVFLVDEGVTVLRLQGDSTQLSTRSGASEVAACGAFASNSALALSSLRSECWRCTFCKLRQN